MILRQVLTLICMTNVESFINLCKRKPVCLDENLLLKLRLCYYTINLDVFFKEFSTFLIHYNKLQMEFKKISKKTISLITVIISSKNIFLFLTHIHLNYKSEFISIN